MSNLEEFLNNKLPEDKEDLVMKQITKLRMDGMKKDYDQKLKATYGVSKDDNRGKNKMRTLLVFGLVASTIALLYFAFGTNLLINKTDHSRSIASYIQKNKVYNYDIVRGGKTKDAYNEYELGNYTQAIGIWESNEMNLQDSFYLALSHMYADQYNIAEIKLSELNQKIGPDDKYYPEFQLYWALTYKLLGDVRAPTIYNSWPKDSWMAKEYRKVLKIND